MDTTHTAYTAEDLISYRLQRSGLLVAKPKFDREGTDLLVFMNVGSGAKFVRVQCKGRSLIKSSFSNVEIFESYLTDGFVLFLFINNGAENETNLYCFFSDDIKKNWKRKSYSNSAKNIYRISFSKSTFQNPNKKGNLTDYLFSEEKIDKIKKVIQKTSTKNEFKQLFDLINKQNELIKLTKEKNKLESLVKEIEHTEEKKDMLEEKIKLMEDFYKSAKMK